MNYKFSNDRPIFIQLSEYIEADILSGVFAEESPLPSTTELSVELKLNPATTLKGVNILVDQGLVEKKRGIGMFVVKGAREKILKKQRNAFNEEYLLPLISIAKNLGIERDDLIKSIMEIYK